MANEPTTIPEPPNVTAMRAEMLAAADDIRRIALESPLTGNALIDEVQARLTALRRRIEALGGEQS